MTLNCAVFWKSSANAVSFSCSNLMSSQALVMGMDRFCLNVYEIEITRWYEW